MKYCEGLTIGESNVYGVTVCGDQMATITKNVCQAMHTLLTIASFFSLYWGIVVI